MSELEESGKFIHVEDIEVVEDVNVDSDACVESLEWYGVSQQTLSCSGQKTWRPVGRDVTELKSERTFVEYLETFPPNLFRYEEERIVVLVSR